MSNAGSTLISLNLNDFKSDKMGVSEDCKMRLAAGGGFMAFGLCVTLWSIPMIITYYIFALKNKDPDSCYVNAVTFEAFS